MTYALTDRDGASALDIGRGASGSGYRYLHAVLEQIFAGSTVHGGTLLAPLGIRYVIARDGDLSAAAIARLRRQVDLDLVPAGDLSLFRNGRWLPIASIVEGEDAAAAFRASELRDVVALPPIQSTPMRRRDDAWLGRTGSGTAVAYLAEQFDGGWQLEDGTRPEVAFGWATLFPVDAGRVVVRHAGGPVRGIVLAALIGAWAVALWVTRRQASA